MARLFDMTEVETAWVAGILEGEGCFLITFNYKKGRLYPRVRCVMTDYDIIQRLADVTGVGRICHPSSRGPHTKPVWSWQVSRFNDVVWLVKEIRPFMGLRRGDKIDEILSLFGSVERGYGRKGIPV